MICNYLLPVFVLSCYSLNGFFRRAVLYFEEVRFIKFSFCDNAINIVSKKYLPNLRSQRFSPVFSSRSFIVLDFVFGSMIHFEYVFVFVQGKCLFPYFVQGCPIVPAPVLCRPAFLHCLASPPLLKNSWSHILGALCPRDELTPFSFESTFISVIVFAVISTLSDINIAIPTLFWLVLNTVSFLSFHFYPLRVFIL